MLKQTLIACVSMINQPSINPQNPRRVAFLVVIVRTESILLVHFKAGGSSNHLTVSVEGKESSCICE